MKSGDNSLFSVVVAKLQGINISLFPNFLFLSRFVPAVFTDLVKAMMIAMVTAGPVDWSFAHVALWVGLNKMLRSLEMLQYVAVRAAHAALAEIIITTATVETLLGLAPVVDRAPILFRSFSIH